MELKKRLQKKDLDARWVKKYDINHYGYKNSIWINAEHGIIRRFVVTPANINDKQMLPKLLDPENQDTYVWADSGERVKGLLSLDRFKNWNHERAPGNHPLGAASIKCSSISSEI